MHNALEEAVRDAYEALRSTDPSFCGCSRCHEDVLTMVMNQAHPRYIVGDPLGSAVTRVALSRRQLRAELSVIVLDAMRRVAAEPRHPKEVDGGASH
jgi:late competence development protein ComFB